MMKALYESTTLRVFLVVPALLLTTLTWNTDAATVTGTLGIDPGGRAGADGQGRVLLFAPNPLQGGSSVSHFDRSATPNLLMEPNVSANLAFGRVDLTRPLMEDIGWSSGSSNLILRVQDAAGQGFNDPTLGNQRTQAIQRALQVWSGVLRSSVPINVGVKFSDLTCGASGGTLASAGPQFVFDNFPGAPMGNTWYSGPLAEALSGQNLSLQDNSDGTAPDIEVTFNSQIDNSCLGAGSRFYYGLDGNEPPGTINFVTVALHELGHGLGFISFANEGSGMWFMGQPDIFGRFLLNNTNGLTWPQMTNAQRAASAINSDHLVWSGNRVTAQVPNFLNPGPALTIGAPASVAGRYQITDAQFGPPFTNPGISGRIVLANDGSGSPSEACNPLVNGGQIAGHIAMVDRGNCNFTVKVKHAQNAGARGVIVVNNTGGNSITLGGTDNTITIPSGMIRRADGDRIKAAMDAVDPPGALMLGTGSVSVNEGAGTVTLNVRRNGGSIGTVSVSYATSNGTALAGQDYTSTSGTLTFANGESGPMPIQIPLLDDATSENNESFTLALQNPTGGATLGTPSSTQITLIDNEPCEPSATTACVQQGRFKVSVTWTNFDDEDGVGTIIPSSADDSVLFWFFGSENWEMLMKVIDGCSFNNHFWVFAAATTNVEYTLRVTDTETGASKEFFNPLGNASEAVTDTTAFATCP
jgi:hypothetical protein